LGTALKTLHLPPWLQATPFALVFVLFLVLPLALVGAVSFWQATDYELVPAFSGQNYLDVFNGCSNTAELCVALKTYLSTLKFCVLVWAITLVIGFVVAYFLAFHVPSTSMQTLLFVVCTVPFWTSNVIRMISWVPLLGRNGLVNQGLMGLGLVMFMIVPIFNSMKRIDPALIEASRDSGATGWQTVWNVVIPLCRTGIVIGSIFVVTIVMGDFVTIGVMGGQQIASVGKVIQVQTSYLQFPMAAANAVILLATTLMMVWALTRVVDLRREL
jgi:putative spermidine/putrescine transport system permease protein